MRKKAWLASIVVLIAGLCSCDFDEPAEGLPVGVILPFSGELKRGADQIKWTLEHAKRKENADFRFIYRDDGGKPGRAAQLVHDLAEEGVFAIVGTMSSPCALAAAERAEALTVPFLTPMATHSGVTEDRDWVYRMCFTDPQQGARMAEHAYTLGLRRVAIVRDVTNDYSLGLSDAFAAEYLSKGGQVVGTWEYRADYDRGEDLARWAQSNGCDAIYLPLYGEAVAFVVDSTEPLWSDRPFTFLGGDGWHTRSVTEYLAKRTGTPYRVDVTAHFPRDERDEAVHNFVSDFTNARDEAPTSSSALAYDLVKVLNRAARDGVSDRAELRDGIRRELEHFEGLTGDTFFDANTGTITKRVSVLSWRDGDWHEVEDS